MTVTATATDNAEVLAAEVRVGDGAWQPMAAVDGAFGGSSELVTATVVAPPIDGAYPICVRATDSSGNTSAARCSTLTVSTPKSATSLSYTGPTTVRAGATMTLSALLTQADNAQPIVGATVTFVMNKTTYTALTDGSGVARVSVKAPSKTGSYPIAVRWADTASQEAATASATLTVTK